MFCDIFGWADREIGQRAPVIVDRRSTSPPTARETTNSLRDTPRARGRLGEESDPVRQDRSPHGALYTQPLIAPSTRAREGPGVAGGEGGMLSSPQLVR